MINPTKIKDSLALDRRSFTELATGFTAIAVAGATLYNLGFFAPIEWSLISLLSVQDLLIGSAIGAIPMVISAALALVFGRLITLAPSQKATALAIGIPALAVTGFGFFHFYSGTGQSTFGHMACGYLALGVIAAGINATANWRHMAGVWLIFSLLYIPTVLGMTDSAAATDPTRAMSEIETDRGVIQGRIVRVTSAYVLIAKDNAVITMPMNNVREIRWFFVTSPPPTFWTDHRCPQLTPPIRTRQVIPDPDAVARSARTSIPGGHRVQHRQNRIDDDLRLIDLHRMRTALGHNQPPLRAERRKARLRVGPAGYARQAIARCNHDQRDRTQQRASQR